MELSNEFVVTAPIAATWAILTDLERIAPCLPGAQLDEVEGEEYRGTVKIKVGPITSQYKGTATFVSLDEVNHKAVLRATGRDTRGQGNATATVTASLSEEGDKTKVSVVTELDITGKVAQFGRGMLADISTKLLGQFAERLENDVVSSFDAPSPSATATDEAKPSAESAGATPEAPTAAPGIRQIAPMGNAPVDLGKLAGSSVLKAIPVVGVVVLAIIKIFRRKSKRS
ncbi:MAG TPA: SRPBCC family protein [Acidimicrobiales bacterium]|nr:SRPBCC family protein [Acidimicrobiales bacterium]